jgi:amino acid permease
MVRVVLVSFLITNCILGSGIVAIPFAFAETGLIPGIVLLLLACAMATLSMRFAVTAAKAQGASEYDALAEKILGKLGAVLVNVFLFLNCFGCLLSCLIIWADSIAPIAFCVCGDTCSQRYIVVAVLASILVLPFCLLNNFGRLSWISFVKMILVPAMLVLLSVASISIKREHFDILHRGTNILPGLGIMLNGLVAGQCTFFAYKSLDHPSDRLWTACAFLGHFQSMVLVLAFGLLGFFMFGFDLVSNVFKNYDLNDSTVLVAQLLLGLAILLSFPLNFFPTRTSIMNLVGIKSEGRLARVVVSLIIFYSCVAIAIFVDNLSFVLALCGTLTASCLSFLFPCLFYLITVFPYFKHEYEEKGFLAACKLKQSPETLETLLDEETYKIKLSSTGVVIALIIVILAVLVMVAGTVETLRSYL